MLKGNNKGFAITTVLYGLSILSILLIGILMSIMSNIRSNSRDIVKSVENDLNRVSKAESVLSSVEQSGTPTSQEYMIAEGQDGFYKIELWGAQGGTNGGYGAYTSGIIYLKEGDIGKNRAESCIKKLQDLNYYVKVSASNENLPNDGKKMDSLKKYNVIFKFPSKQ